MLPEKDSFSFEMGIRQQKTISRTFLAQGHLLGATADHPGDLPPQGRLN
jgi:hypothetical protein